MPTLVPNTERNAGLVRPSSTATRHSSSIERSRPPYSSGIESPKRPSSRISATMSSGTSSSSATLASSGRSRSATKRRTVSISCSRVSRSRAMPGVLLAAKRVDRGGGEITYFDAIDGFLPALETRAAREERADAGRPHRRAPTQASVVIEGGRVAALDDQRRARAAGREAEQQMIRRGVAGLVGVGL